MAWSSSPRRPVSAGLWYGKKRAVIGAEMWTGDFSRPPKGCLVEINGEAGLCPPSRMMAATFAGWKEVHPGELVVTDSTGVRFVMTVEEFERCCYVRPAA
jgi:hypothetical protein